MVQRDQVEVVIVVVMEASKLTTIRGQLYLVQAVVEMEKEVFTVHIAKIIAILLLKLVLIVVETVQYQ